jgi:transposase
MASPLSLLKSVLNLNKNYMYVEEKDCEEVTVTVQKYKETYEQKQIHIHARPYKSKQCLCPKCMKKCPGYDTKYTTESSWRAPNLNGVPVYILYRPQRIQCPEHGVLREYIPWEDGNTRFTADFNDEVAWMVCRMSKSAVCTFEDINWRTAGNCVRAAHNRLEPDTAVRLHGLRRICVDETAYRKGQSYITVVYDMDRNRVVWVHENHGLEVFRLFCLSLSPEEREKIEIVAGDGAQWIDTCTKEYFPNATRCIDFFHVVQWAGEALDKVRISTASKASREYERMKKEYQKAEADEAQAKEEAERQRLAALEELAAMPQYGRPSKRKKELIAFLDGLKEAIPAETLEQQRLAAQEELDSMPKKGRPSRRMKELRAFLDGSLNCLPPKTSSSNKKGRPRKDQLSPEHQELLDELKQRASDIKGSRYALGHNPENCSESQTEKLKLIENEYPDLYRAYQLKESLRLILHMKDAGLAVQELEKWLNDAAHSGLAAMAKLSEKVGRHKEAIAASVRLQANSAKSEAVNTSIKVLIKMARGFRNIPNLMALVYLKCSDLVIPLNNRPQMTSEQAAAARKTANELRKLREASPVPA